MCRQHKHMYYSVLTKMILLITIRSWLYTLIVAMDANFQLKSRLCRSVNREPTLGLGWSYFVDNGPYSDFIKDLVMLIKMRYVFSAIYDSEPLLTPTHRFRHVSASKHSSTCSQRSQKVFAQRVWLQSAVLVTNSFGRWVWGICKRERGKQSLSCQI
jgi:hypothetical protein